MALTEKERERIIEEEELRLKIRKSEGIEKDLDFVSVIFTILFVIAMVILIYLYS